MTEIVEAIGRVVDILAFIGIMVAALVVLELAKVFFKE